MKFIISAMLCCLLLSLPLSVRACPLCDSAPESVEFNWTLKNGCHEAVKVAVQYNSEWDIRTAGWWSLNPGKKVVFQVHSRYFAYYAKNENRRWAGKESNGIAVAINPDGSFDYEGSELPALTDETVMFRQRSAVEDHTTEITCSS